MKARKTVGGVVTALLAFGGLIPATAPALAAPATTADTSGIEQCMPMGGVDNVSKLSPNQGQPKDRNVNVYAGNNFTRLAGSELEGQLVVNGNADFTTGGYNIGRVGVGSGLLPVAGSDVIRVGGNLNFSGTEYFETAIIDASDQFLESHVKVGGSKTGAGVITSASTGSDLTDGLGREAALGTPNFADWPNDEFSVLRDFANRNVGHQNNVAGTASIQWGTLLLSGDASAARHVFTIPDASALTKFSLQVGENIDPTEPIVINVRGDAASLEIQGLLAADNTAIETTGKRFGQLASQILWVFPDATEVRLGGGQLPGSVVVPTVGSTTTMAAAGSNGRIWVAGDLVQDRQGSEFHSFPFIGDPASLCGEPPTPGESPDPEVPVEAAPIAPVVEQAKCTADGSTVDPTITFTDTDKIKYNVVGEIKAGQTVKVVATPAEGVKLTGGEGWTLNEDGTATFVVVLDEVDCQTEPEVPVEVAPVAPVVEQAQCTADGSTVDPTITFTDTDKFKYSVVGEIKAGQSVEVVATPAEGVKLTGGEGWTLNADGTATFVVVLDEVDCQTDPEAPIKVAPVSPEVTQVQCLEEGGYIEPSVTLPDTEGITYIVSGAVQAGSDITVTATPEAGFELSPSQYWTLHEDGTATLDIWLPEATCDDDQGPNGPPVIPQAPGVEQPVCLNGVATEPKIHVTDTDNVDYRIEGEVKAGSTVKVVAHPKNNSWFIETEGWKNQSNGTSIYEVVLEEVNCDPVEEKPVEVAPINPIVVQGTCTADGTVVAPSVTMTDSAQVKYSVQGEIKAGETVKVVATPQDGFTLGKAEGWTLNADGTATFVVVLDEVDCQTEPEAPVEVAPVAPVVEQAKCTADGSTVDPTITLTDTDKFKYSVVGEIKAGQTVKVVATPAEGVKLTGGEGWTLNADGTATLEIILDAVDCETPVDPEPQEPTVVVPAAPIVEQGKCVAGDLVDPALTLIQTEGIDYAVDGKIAAGETIKVVATAKEGFILGAAEGWTMNEDGTASFEIVFATAEDCVEQSEPTETPAPSEPTETPAPSEPTETPAPSEPTDGTESDELADTGMGSMPFVLVGLALAAAGALIVFGRRKQA